MTENRKDDEEYFGFDTLMDTMDDPNQDRTVEVEGIITRA